MTDIQPLLQVHNLSKHYEIKSGLIRRKTRIFKAVDDISFDVRPGETLGLVGESGCGKTTTGRMLLRLITPTSGKVIYHDDDGTADLSALRGEALRQVRRKIQMIFQDPYASLNPRMRVAELIAEPLRSLQPELKPAQVEERIRWIADAVSIRPEMLSRYPHAFSGGQRQRICIARALVVRPRLVVCDEPVSALDVSVRAQIINLLKDLQKEFGLTYIFIAHDLAIVENISDRIAVMTNGKIVELGDNTTIFHHPQHEYTRKLLASIPTPDPKQRQLNHL